MRLFTTLGIAAVALTFAACSSDSGGGGTGGAAGSGTGGSGGSTGGSGGSTGGSAGAATGGSAGSATGGAAGSATGGAAGSSGETCQECTGANCGSEVDACQADADCAALLECANAPNCDTACIQQCLVDHPEGAAVFQDVIVCATTNCPQCNG